MTESAQEEPQATPEAETGETAAPEKKKSKTTRSLRDLQKAERHVSKAALRMSKAVTEGIATYLDERDRSSRKKRDGAFWDFPHNAAEGMAVAMQESSRVPADLARALDSRTARRAIRLGTRILLWPLGR